MVLLCCLVFLIYGIDKKFPNKLVDQQLKLHLLKSNKIITLPTITTLTELIYITEIKYAITTNLRNKQ